MIQTGSSNITTVRISSRRYLILMIKVIIFKTFRCMITNDLKYVYDPRGIRRWCRLNEVLEHFLFRQVHIKEYQAIQQWLSWLQCWDMSSLENHKSKRGKYLSGCWLPGKEPFDYREVKMSEQMRVYLDDLDKRFNRFMK